MIESIEEFTGDESRVRRYRKFPANSQFADLDEEGPCVSCLASASLLVFSNLGAVLILRGRMALSALFSIACSATLDLQYLKVF